MTRNRLIRLLCVALVTTTLALALILAVAVIGSTVAEGAPVESENPHFRPFFPEGSMDIGNILDSIDTGDFTRDPEDTLPPDPDIPDVTLPEWDGDFEWPTLPPTLQTDPDFELPTLPEDWDTLPEEWGTLPEEWGDLPFDPEDLGDLLAGMNGDLGLPPGALAAGVASQLTVMDIYAEKSDTLYLKMQSFGDYTGQGWSEAEEYGLLFGEHPYYYSAMYVPHFRMNEITPFVGYPLTITPKMDVRVMPYFITGTGDPDQVQTSDVMAMGASDRPYTLYYRPYSTYVLTSPAASDLAAYEYGYALFVSEHYLAVDDTTMAYMQLIIEREGFDKNDPDIIQKVATYIQNAATYNLAYNQNLDREPNVALAFLGAYKEGVCRHYASAATLLYRALGIPARYTVGFMTDVRGGETNAVKGMDAHAWVEVYEEGFGWRYVEVTGSPAGNTPTDPPETDTSIVTLPNMPPDTTPGTGGDGTTPPLDPEKDPTTWGDLMAGTKGSLAPLSSIPNDVWKNTVFWVTTDYDERLLLKLKSFGDFTGQGFATVTKDPPEIYGYSAAYLAGLYLTAEGQIKTHTLKLQSPMYTYAAPYYISPTYAPDEAITVGDTRITGNGLLYYQLPYIPASLGFIPTDATAALHAEYAAYAERTFTYVDTETAAYLEALIRAQGWDRMSAAEAIPAVAAYLRMYYTLNAHHDAALHDEDNAVIAFLDHYREGSSRHFAAAATLIYRMLGIPARYTVGYLAFAEAGEQTKITGEDAYAWSEVYIKGVGWVYVDVVELDPTDIPEVTLRPVDLKFLFDGAAHAHTGELTGFEAFEAKGYTYKATVSGIRSACGTTTAPIVALNLYDPMGRDVTDQFTITCETGILTVYMAELWLESPSASKVYDGTPLTVTDVNVVVGSLPDGYSIEVIPDPYGQTQMGVGYAKFNVEIWYDNGNGNPIKRTHYFIIHKLYGTHTVTPAPLTVKADDAEKVYDGSPLTADGVSILGGALAEGDYIDSYTLEGSQTRVGKSENLITGIVIRNRIGSDVTACYAIETVAGVLKVTAP